MKVNFKLLGRLIKSVEFLLIGAFVIIGGLADMVQWDWGIAFAVIYLVLNVFGFANKQAFKSKK